MRLSRRKGGLGDADSFHVAFPRECSLVGVVAMLIQITAECRPGTFIVCLFTVVGLFAYYDEINIMWCTVGFAVISVCPPG